MSVFEQASSYTSNEPSQPKGMLDDEVVGGGVERNLERKGVTRQFNYINSDGQRYEAVHPVALDFRHGTGPLVEPSLRRLRSDDEVLIQPPGADTPAWVPFDGYLDMFTASYPDYFRMVKQRESETNGGAKDDPLSYQRALLYETHRRAIDRRTDDVRRDKQKYEQEFANRDNMQQETQAHSEVFRKVFDDLNIPGIGSASVQRRNDYYDTIDDFILLDPEALATREESETDDGEPDYDRYLHIGVQRTFGSQSGSQESLERDALKKKKIREKPIYWIPEHLEWGPVTRSYFPERFEDYAIQGKGGKPNYTEQLYALRAKQSREQGVAANSLELPPIYRVLGDTPLEGKEVQHLWAHRALTKIRKEFEGYTDRDWPKEQKDIMDRYVKALDLAVHRVSDQLEHIREQQTVKQKKAS